MSLPFRVFLIPFLKYFVKNYLLHLLLALCLWQPALAKRPGGTAPTVPSLATALNPDGTLKMGLVGSFDAHRFQMSTAPDGRPVFRPATTTGTGDEFWQNGFGLPNGTDDQVLAVVQTGTTVYVGGIFTVAGAVAATNVAKWDGTAWSSLGVGTANGVNGFVYALAVAPNGDLYAGGTFSQAGAVPANNVARWNGTTWSSLGTGSANGVNARVSKLAVASTGEVYVGGQFTQAGGVAASRLARWSGTAWSVLGTAAANGVNGNVSALAVAPNGSLYVGGIFTLAGSIAAANVACWSGTTWTSLGIGTANGTNGAVYALAVAGSGDVYVGGSYSQAGGVSTNSLARWNGASWNLLGSGITNGIAGSVSALGVAGNGELYVSGQFLQAGGVAANRIARWSGNAWSTLGTGTTNGITGSFILAMAVTTTGEVYIGGEFRQANGVPVSNVAQWNGTAWNTMGPASARGVNGTIYTLAVAPNGDVYAGGDFTQAGGVLATNVARWNGLVWNSLGTGTANGVNNIVHGLAVAPTGEVYVGGEFTQAGGVPAARVAKWNGTAWSTLGTGANGNVLAVAVAGSGDVYIGGFFSGAGGVSTPKVARWNGTAWSGLGTGLGSGNSVENVAALVIAGNGDVYAGGGFGLAGGLPANSIARWNGTAWSALGTGATNGVGSGNSVLAMTMAANGDLYVGGAFSQAGGIPASRIARWNGTTWSALGTGTANGVNGQVQALGVAPNGDVYVGGLFSQAGGASAPGIARWSGTAWSPLGTGLNRFAAALVVAPTSKVYVGGPFNMVGDGSKVTTHFGVYDPNAPLAIAGTRSPIRAAVFPNPAHGTVAVRLPADVPAQPILVLDMEGRVVRRYPTPASSDAVLDLHGLPGGVYLVRCGQFTERLLVE
jgi:hypothetical protein